MDCGNAMQLNWKKSRRRAIHTSGWTLLLIFCFMTVFVETANARRQQGRLANRRYSIRKTGEFGRKIHQDNLLALASSPSTANHQPPHLSQHLELPSPPSQKSRFRTSLPSASSPEVVYLKHVVGGGNPNRLEIRKPSLDLELPRFSGQGHNFLRGFDQIAEETEDNEGYAYPNPTEEDSNTEGYQYPEPKIKPNEPLIEEDRTPTPEQPDPSQPEVVGADQIFGLQKPETDIDIDADSLRPQKSKPDVVGVPSDAKIDKECPEDGSDPSCWPHGYSGVIPGKAGEDYPILSEIIDTGFTCDEMPYSGYYADTNDQSRCQMFHICLKKNRFRKTQQWSFLCPNGTIFSQPDFVCVWWGDAQECSDVMIRSMYNLNEQLGWDNQTETGSVDGATSGQRSSSEKLQTAMSTFNAAAAAAASKKSSGLPYRVPVKVAEGGAGGRSRTKLQEVTGALSSKDNFEDLEYGGEESNNFETSLSNSQGGYQNGDVNDEGSHQPFIVNRPEAPTDNPPPPSSRDYDNQEVVMMPSMQRFPDGSEGYAEVPVMFPSGAGAPSAYQHSTDNPTHENYRQAEASENDPEGYRYPNPATTEGTSTPAPTYLPPRRTTTATPRYRPRPLVNMRTTTEYYPPPTIPTEPPIPPEDPQQSQNYEEDQQSYQRVTTTDKPFGQQEEDDQGYRYPEPQQVIGTTTEQSNQIYQEEPEDGYSYPSPQQSDKQQIQQQVDFQDSSDGYPDLSTTTENYNQVDDDQGYRYPNPTTTQRSSRFRQPQSQRLQTTTEVVTECTITPDASQQDTDDIGYNYPAPDQGPSQFESLRETTTTSSTSSENYDYSTTQQYADLQDNSVVTTTTTEIPSSQTTQVVDLPPGGYLPPKFSPQINQVEPVTSSPSASSSSADQDQVDYEDDDEGPSNNEVDGGASSSASGGDESGYNYNIPTPPGGGGGSETPDVILNGGSLDSDEKLNEILKQIQSGGIEAVDSSGRPIEFNKLKELLLNSPRGSVELKSGGPLDSSTSASTSTEVPPTTSSPSTSQQVGGDQGQGYQQQSQSPQQPIYHTVSTATITPSRGKTANLPFTSSLPDYYLPPNNPSPQSQSPPPRNNEIFQNYDQPSYSINLPSREFQTHSVVSSNTIPVDNIQNQNYNFPSAPASTSPQNNQFRQQQPQSGYYQQQSNQLNPSSSSPPPQQNYYQLPQNNYLPPSPPSTSSPQPQFTQDYERTNILNNLILPAPQAQRQTQQNSGGGLSPPPLPPSSEYLPPRQATSSILQPQYYQPPSSSSQSTSKYLGQPIRLTDNIELQQSFAIPTQQPLDINLPPSSSSQVSSSTNPLVDPKNIKIVPALFVHEHTSVENHNANLIKTPIDQAFQTLDTAQSTYYSTTTTTSLPSGGGGGRGGSPQRQFFRRSNPTPSSSPPIIEPAHQVTSFTLEDARTPEELQKYHHQDLKRFHTETIVKGGGGVILQQDGEGRQQYQQSPQSHRPPPTTRKSLPVIASIAREPQGREGRRKEGGGDGGGSGTRFSIPTRNVGGDGGGDIISSHRNEEYFIPVSGSLTGGSGGGGGGGRSSSSSGSDGGRNRNGGGGNVRNSNSDNYSQFRVSGRGSRGGSGGGGGDSLASAFNFVEPADEQRTFWSKQLFL